MNVDLQYALNQLKGINMEKVDDWRIADRIQRALDALERMEEAEMNEAIDTELPPLPPTSAEIDLELHR